MAPDQDDLWRWAHQLGRWWYRRSTAPASAVLAWASLPGRAQAAEGTLWWVETDLGELLCLLERGAFRDLTGVAVEPWGAARLFHPVDADELTEGIGVWRDRLIDVAPMLDQIDRIEGLDPWDGWSLRLDHVTHLDLAPELVVRGWREHHGGLLVLRLQGLRVDLTLEPRRLFEEPVDPTVTYQGVRWAEVSVRRTDPLAGSLSGAARWEVRADVRRATGR